MQTVECHGDMRTTVVRDTISPPLLQFLFLLPMLLWLLLILLPRQSAGY